MFKRIHQRLSLTLLLVMSLVLLVSCSCSGWAQALVVSGSPQELSEGPEAVLVGSVISTDSCWNTDRTRIYSDVLVSVEETLEGAVASSTIRVIVPGGTVGQITQCLSDTPRFAGGQRAVLCLKQVRAEGLAEAGLETSDLSVPSSQLYMLYQGKLDVAHDMIGDLSLPQLEKQGAWIFNESDNNRDGLQVEDNSITQEESGYVYSGQKWYGDWPVVNYVVNAPDGDSNAAVQNAGSTWSNAGAKFAFNYTGTHSRPGGYQYNGVNEIVWCDLGSGGMLGRAVWWYQGMDQIIEADMELNSYCTWSTATPTPPGAVDLETVVLHEFGHWLSLGHSDTYEAIMYAWYKGIQRTLHDDDIAGIGYIYGTVPTCPIWYQDSDGDGYGNPAVSQQSCPQPDGYVLDDSDCDDTDADINPETLWYEDSDGDGYGNPDVGQQSCTQPDGYVLDNTDCNDNAFILHPGQTWYKDADRDGYSDGTMLISCQGPICYWYNLGPQHKATTETRPTRPTGDWYDIAANLKATSGDCDDNDPTVNPGATEVPFNGKDDDCNPATPDVP